MRVWLLRHLALVVWGLFVGLSGLGAPVYAQGFSTTDDLSRPVVLTKAPQRLVSLAPELTEWIYALGAEHLLVGVSDDCDYPAAARRLPKLGPYFKPNLERILAARPELVFVSGRGTPQELAAALGARGVPCYVFFPHSPEELLAGLVRLGTALGREQQARDLAATLRREFSSLVPAATQKRPQTALLVNIEPLYAIGPGTFGDALLGALGGRNVYADAATPYPQVSTESLLSRQPELILLAVPPTQGAPTARETLARYPLQAREHGLLIEVDPDLFSRAGPRFIASARLLAGYLAKARLAGEQRGRP